MPLSLPIGGRSIMHLAAVGMALLMAGPAAAQAPAIVQGTVTDLATGAPVPEVRVTITGTVLQATTDARGMYRIAGVPPRALTIEMRRIGYRAASLPVTLASGQTFAANAQLTASAVALDAMVITGTAGDQTRRAQAATVAEIPVSILMEITPVVSMQQILQSRVTGVSVLSASGSSGTSNQIRVRGVSSISLSNEPLVYVDGIQIATGGGAASFAGGQSYERLHDLNPDDIESIELVKGPAAATLYGANASSGVIQVITKRGRVGASRFIQSVGIEHNSIHRNFEPLTNYARCTAADVASSNNVLCFGQPVGTLVSDNPLLREGAFRTGRRRGIGWSGRGGGERYGFYTSLSDDDETGVFPNNAFERKSGRVNFLWMPAATMTLDAGVGMNRSRTDLPDNDNNLLGWLANAHLGLPTTRTVDGTGANGYSATQRDLAALRLLENQRQTHRTVSTITGTWAPRAWFTNRLTAGADWIREEDRRFEPKNSRGSYPINIGYIEELRRGIERYTFDYLGNLRHDLPSNLTSNLSFGMQLLDTREEHIIATGEGLTVNSHNVVTAAALRSGGQAVAVDRSIGLISQWQLGLNDRLYGQLGARFDKASSLGTEVAWVVLPKVSASWVVSEEPFWKVGILNTLRIRAAWGTTGRIPRGGAALTTLTSAPYLEGAEIHPGAVPTNPGNPGLRFERGEELEAGVDAGLFDDRIGLELTYFNKRSNDLILARPLPPSLGFTQSPFVNIGSVANRGWELAVTTSLAKGAHLSWDLRLGANTLDNAVSDMGGVPAFGALNRVEAGMQVGAWVASKILDVNETTGVVTVSDERRFIGNVLPTFEGHLANTITLMRHLRVYGSLDVKRGHLVRNQTDFFRETQVIRSNNRLDTLKLSRRERLRRYGNPNAGPGVPAFISDSGRAKTVNDVREAFLQRGDFVRFRELAVTLTLPKRLAGSIRTQTASITVGGQNLALWTDYEGYDPEVIAISAAAFNRDDFFTQPPVKRWIARLNLTF